MIPATDLIGAISEAAGLKRELVERYWRALREARLVPVGKTGRAGKPADVGSSEAATLLAAILGSESARNCPDAVQRLQRTVSGELCRTFSRSALGKEVVILAPVGATFLEMLRNLLDTRRCSDMSVRELGVGFRNVKVGQSGGEIWGHVEIDTIELRPGQYMSQFYTVPPPRPVRYDDIPKSALPAGLQRSSLITDAAVLRIAQVLGPVDRADMDWPKFRTVGNTTQHLAVNVTEADDAFL